MKMMDYILSHVSTFWMMSFLTFETIIGSTLPHSASQDQSSNVTLIRSQPMHSNLNETNDFGWPAISNLSTDPSVSSGQVSDPNITTLALIKNCSSDVTGLKDEDQKREKSDDDDQKKRSNSSIGKESIIHWNQSRSSSENFSLRVSSSRMIDPIDDKDNRNDHSDIKAPENDTKFIKTTSHHTFNDSTGGVLNLNLTELERNSTSFLDRVNHISVPTNLSKVMNLTPSINLKQSSDLMDQDVRNQSLELKFNQSDKPLTSFDHSGPIIENQTLSIGVGAERNDLKNSSQVEVQNQNSSLISAGIKMDNINTTNNLINSEEISFAISHHHHHQLKILKINISIGIIFLIQFVFL